MLACTRLQWVNEGVNNISRDDWSLLPARSVIVFLSPTSTMTSSSEITWLNKDYIHTSLVTFGNHLIFFHERFHTLQKSNLILELRWNHRNHQRLNQNVHITTVTCCSSVEWRGRQRRGVSTKEREEEKQPGENREDTHRGKSAYTEGSSSFCYFDLHSGEPAPPLMLLDS